MALCPSLKPKCKHNNVTVRSFHPITKRPKKGICDDCGKYVIPKLIWEEVNI